MTSKAQKKVFEKFFRVDYEIYNTELIVDQ